MHTRTLLILAAASVTAVAPLVTPAAATADDRDAAYLMALSLGGTPVSDTDYAISMGHAVCIDLDHGVSRTLEITVIAENPGFTLADAAYLIGAATAAYCPRNNIGSEAI